MSVTSKAVFLRQYVKANQQTGQPTNVFVYGVVGTQAAKDHYVEGVKKAVDRNTGVPIEPRFQDDDPTKSPLFFTTNYSGENISIAYRREEGTPFLDNSEMAKMASLVNQAGTGLLGQMMAQEAARHILGVGGNRTANSPAERVQTGTQGQPMSQELVVDESTGSAGANPDEL